MTRSPWSHGTTPVVGQWGSWPMSSKCYLPATRSHQPQGTIWGIPAASIGFCHDWWWRGGQWEGVSSIKHLFFSTGFCHSEYSPVWLECYFCIFVTCLHCCCVWWGWRVREARGWEGVGFTHLQLCCFPLVMVVAQPQLPAFTPLLQLTLGSTSMCTSLWSAEWGLQPDSPLLLDPLGQWRVLGCVCHSRLCPSLSCLPCLLWFAHFGFGSGTCELTWSCTW